MMSILKQMAGLVAGLSATLLMALPGGAGAAESDRTGANKARVAQTLQAWKEGRSQLGDMLAEDVKWTITGNSSLAGTTVGKARLMDKVLKPFGARFSSSSQPFRPTAIHAVYGDGDVVVALFDGQGVTNEGETYSNSYAWVLTFRGGLVVEAVAFFDAIAFDRLMVR